MTLVKKQYNGRELPVFENVDEATEYFARRRKTIYKGINALFMIFGGILGVLQVLFDPPLIVVLGGLVILCMGCFYCYAREPNIRAPKRFRVLYSEEDGKWLIFPVNRYPAVAFVRENEYNTMEEDYTIYDYAVDVFKRDLKKNAVANYIFAASIFLSVILLPIIGFILCVTIAVGAFVVGMIILYW